MSLAAGAYLPTIVAHADWGSAPRKRWLARAVLRPQGGYRAEAPEPAGELSELLPALRAKAGIRGSVLLGFDFPIGLPQRYAQACGITDFPAWMASLGRDEWSDFYRVAEQPEQISLHRPFYPQRPGSARQAHLLQALGMERMDDLRRRCERAHPGRRPAAPLFWTLGGQQVGKAAISGWRDVLVPAIEGREASSGPIRLWPFAGPLGELMRPKCVVIAETYPAEFYAHLGVKFHKSGKRSPAARTANAAALLGWAASAGVGLSPTLQEQIGQGFGPLSCGEDPFDALVGLFGMLSVVLGRQPSGEPGGEGWLQVEGWILGQVFAVG